MIVRIWRGRTSGGKADAYQKFVTTTVFPKLEAIGGYVGGRVLRRIEGPAVEFLVVTEWESWNAIRAFAGNDPEKAVIEPEARALLDHADAHVEHFEMAYESGRPGAPGVPPSRICETNAASESRRRSSIQARSTLRVGLVAARLGRRGMLE